MKIRKMRCILFIFTFVSIFSQHIFGIILKSSDEKEFIIPENVAIISTTIKNMIQDIEEPEKIPIPLPDIQGNILEAIVRCLMEINKLDRRPAGGFISSQVQNIVNKLLGNKSYVFLCDFFLAVNYLDIPQLLNACASIIGRRIAKNLITRNLLRKERIWQRIERQLTKKPYGQINNLDFLIYHELQKYKVGYIPKELLIHFRKHIFLELHGIDQELNISDYIALYGSPYTGKEKIMLRFDPQKAKLTSLSGIDKVKQPEKALLFLLYGHPLLDPLFDPDFPKKPFISFVNLIFLQIRDNPIGGLKNIPGEFFSGLKNLSELNLGGNNFKSLPPAIFDGLKNLKTVNLINKEHPFPKAEKTNLKNKYTKINFLFD